VIEPLFFSSPNSVWDGGKVKPSGRGGLAAKRISPRPGQAPALGLRAGGAGIAILSQTAQQLEDFLMRHRISFRKRPRLRPPKPRARLQFEVLEGRNLPSTTLGLTSLMPVSGNSPLSVPPSSPTVFYNSEVEPQIAVDPTNPAHAVAIWQQDRFRSVGGARALVVSVYNANAPGGPKWSAPAVIPGFDSTEAAGATFARYTDPWVSIAPNGVVYAAALGLTPHGPVPGDTAVLVSESTDGGFTWNTPATLIRDTSSGSTLPINQANDKEMIVADPHDPSGRTAYVVWDQIQFPSDDANFEALHAGAANREDAFFSKTTDGGAHWTPALNLTNFKDLLAASGNQLAVEPDGTLVDVCTLFNGSGSQPPQAGQITVAVIRLTHGSNTWSEPIVGPAVEAMSVTDPNTGAPVRDGKWILSVAVDRSGGPNNGDLYAVWSDGRFSNFTHEDIAFSVSKDGGQTWSAPIKVNQTPTTIPAGDEQAFTPTVAVNSDGAVAVTYYDFRNNFGATPGSGLPTDYFIVVNPNPVSNPSNWSEATLTNASFNMEHAAPTSRGLFLGDYQGLAAAGKNFYALFAQAGSSSSDPSNIWFRDPAPAENTTSGPLSPSSAPTGSPAIASASLPGDLAALGIEIVNGPQRETRALPESYRAASQFIAGPKTPTLAAISASSKADLLSSGDDTEAVDDFFAQEGDQSDWLE
jgi:hypothetical protein